MGNRSDAALLRREFVSQVAVSALALAGSACAAGSAATELATSRSATTTRWDDSWFGRITARHKAVFEQAEIDNGSAASYAVRYLNGMREALGVHDAQAIIVLRHNATPLLLDNAIWEKYGIGEERKLKGPGDAWQDRNPIGALRVSEEAPGPHGVARPQASLPWFAANGHILLGCNIALTAYSNTLARRTKGDGSAIYGELRSHLIAGVILQPNGIYATLRAQEAGCTYMKCS